MNKEEHLDKLFVAITQLSVKIAAIQALLIEKNVFSVDELSQSIENQTQLLMNQVKEDLLKTKQNLVG